MMVRGCEEKRSSVCFYKQIVGIRTGHPLKYRLGLESTQGDSVHFGSTERFSTVKNRVFQQVESCLPLNLEPQELLQITPQEMHRRKKQHFETWLNQFKPQDRRTALLFLEKLRYIDHPRLLGHLKNSHQQLLQALATDGFAVTGSNDPLAKVDFTTLYKASSGDFISYGYRKVNRIPKVKFLDQTSLAMNGQSKADRALVIVDDYLATGGQFFCEALGHGDDIQYPQNKHLAELVKQYKKVYFTVAGIHQKAFTRFNTLQDGRIQEAIDEFMDGYADAGKERYETPLRQKLAVLKPGKLQLICSFVEQPLLSAQNPNLTEAESKKLRQFLTTYNVYKYPFGVGNMEGNTVFYYSVPNTLPDMLWNSKSRQLNADGTPDKSRLWTPLFHRLEDVSTYWFAEHENVPQEYQLW